MPKISVIVPVYKVEECVSKCIESVLAQTYTDFELILVDDGSPDRSGEICDEYAQKDKRIRVFHQKNGGVSSARNLGLKNAIGEWGCFIDSDDVIGKTYLADFKMNDEIADLYSQGYIIHDKTESRKIVLDIPLGASKQNVLCLLEKHNILNSPCYKLYKRKLIIDNNISFDTSLPFGEDHIFTLQYLLYVNDVRYSPSASYIYQRINEDSLTRRVVNPFIIIDYLNKFAHLWFSVCEQFKISNDMKQQLLNSRLHQMILLSTKNGLLLNCNYRELIRQEKRLIKSYVRLNSDFSNCQKIFISVIKYLPTIIVSGIFKLNQRFHISERLQLGF